MLGHCQTSALCFWCCVLTVLLHATAFADEEADLTAFHPTEPMGLPDSKGSSLWQIGWSMVPGIPFSSLNPFGGKSKTKDEGPHGTKQIPTMGPLLGPSKPKPSSGFGEKDPPEIIQSLTSTTSNEKLSSSTEIRTATNPQSVSPDDSTQSKSVGILDSVTPLLEPISSISKSNRVDLSSPTRSNTLPQMRTQTNRSPSQTSEHWWRVSSKPFPQGTKAHDELVPQSDPLAASVTPTTAHTILVTTAPWTTIRQSFNPETTPKFPHTRFTKTTGLDLSINRYNATKEATITRVQPSPADLSFSKASAGRIEEQTETNSPPRRKGGAEDRMPGTVPGLRAHSTAPGVVPDEEEHDRDKDGKNVESKQTKGDGQRTTPQVITTTTSSPYTTGDQYDWLSDPTGSEITYLPDCNQERSGICSITDTWAPANIATSNTTTTASIKQSSNPFLIPARPMFIPLHSDWNSAMASWGPAWEAHVYGLGSIFAMVTVASALNLLCLPLRCPSGCGYFALVSVFLLAAGGTRAFSLLYDAYGHQDRLSSSEASLLLYEAPFPCLTAAFGLVFLLLSMRSRMQLSYSAFQRPCFLACLVLLHFAAAFGPVGLLRIEQQRAPYCLILSLVSRGAFVALALFLSTAYFVFFCYVRADSKHIYHLNNTSPTPAERFNRCPFAESRDWDRAAATVCLSALFSLACAGLQLYAMLDATGLAGGGEVFRPWPWWTFQLCCRVCEAGVCLTLALVVAQPIYCSDHLPQPGSCWTELLAVKSPIIPGTYHWTLSQQEKLAICDNVGRGEIECLPLYTLVDDRLGSSLNGLDLLYHSNRGLAYRDMDLDLPGSSVPKDRPDGVASGGSSFASDSTADLRPPSPINLRRSIDEALFSEDLFPMSLFSPNVPFRCRDLSPTFPYSTSTQPNSNQALRGTLFPDPGLYRTSSCVEIASQLPLSTRPLPGNTDLGTPQSPSLTTNSSGSSPERWRDSSSSSSLYRPSLGLSSSPEGHTQPRSQGASSAHVTASGQQSSHLQRCYRTLGSASQESLDLESEADQSVQEEFTNVCRQMDVVSICSETIDL
ncbi:hypothetical protein UPYG_G00348560 [Umbra pygmaea]|uniref:Proline-rich transmembrane protein 3/4 domain-containing protein n=1 Tax=Umbra pygmaea TaxID=75934 RepID=A0ABD0WEL9_UMBPY